MHAAPTRTNHHAATAASTNPPTAATPKAAHAARAHRGRRGQAGRHQSQRPDPGIVGAAHPVAVVVGVVGADLQRQRHNQGDGRSPPDGGAGGHSHARADDDRDSRRGQRARPSSEQPGVTGPLIGRVAHTSRKLAAVPDLVAIDLPGGPGFVATLCSAWDRGDAVLPLDQRLSNNARRAVVDQLRPARVVHPAGTERLGSAEPVEPGDALVVATSGTTGIPKGVVLTHTAVEASARATSARLRVDPARQRWLACLPLSHVGGLSVVTRSLITGTPVRVLSGFDRDQVLAESGAEVLVSLVATALRRVGAEHFHTVVLGGAQPPAELPPNVVATYGLTETGSGIVYDGLPLQGVGLAIDEATAEIRVRGPMLLRAYRDGTSPLDPAGWFATGDSGWLDADGRLHVHGRMAELIVTGGENVWPRPVEAALETHPGVVEAAVSGCPDLEWGQRVVAWVVPVDPATPPSLADLRAAVADQVAPFAAPRQVVWLDALPRTAIGKVRRDRLPDPGLDG